MTYSIKHLFHIDAPRSEVFKAINSIDGLASWWTVQTEGDAALGGTIRFSFGDYVGPLMKVTTSDQDSKIVWECIESDGWEGHTFTFELDENDGKTRIRFDHAGWEDQGDFYAGCCFSWGRYLRSLRQYVQTGTGEAFGSEGY